MIHDKAQRRAQLSKAPVYFMAVFSATLAALRAGEDVAGWRRDLSDPVVVAAQIEALAAHRIVASRRHDVACGCLACQVRRHDEWRAAVREVIAS